MKRIKCSTGIALCRKFEDGIVRVLMINKRYTYAFYDFVNGHYNDASDRAIIELFNHMTIDEKLDINSMNFAQMWYRVWLHNRVAYHNAAMARWNELVSGDNGERLKRLMRRSVFCAPSRIWEIPKGRKKYSGERDMDCAIREFYEETGIPRGMYHITDGTYNMSYIESGVQYEIRYFIAITSRIIDHKINSSSMTQLGELCDMQWVSAADMAAYVSRDVAGHRRALRFARKHLKMVGVNRSMF